MYSLSFPEMEEKESRRTCKTVNYAEALGDSLDDDDFAVYTPPSKKQKENCENSPKPDGNRGKSCDRDKRNGEKKDEKEKRDHKDHRHEKEKHRDHNRDRKEKNRDSDKNKNEKERHKERHSKEKDRQHERERKSESRPKHDTDREKKDKRHDKDKKHDSERRAYKEKRDMMKSETSSDPVNRDSLMITDHPMTSTQISPGRTTPKLRLTIEEKLFQRELEAALAVSRTETTSDQAAFQDKPMEKELKVDSRVIDQVEPQAGSRLANVNNAPETNHSTSPHSNSPLNHNAKEKTTSPTSSQDQSLTGKGTDNLLEVEKLVKDERSVKVNGNEDPQPSTSTGMTSKRQRKTVVFKEDTDSDSFDGFKDDEGDDSDFSEGSDFTPSPKKKKGKQAITSKNKKSPVSKATVKMPGRSRVTSQKSTPTRATKENTAPQSPSTPTALGISSTVNPHRSPTVVKAKANNSPTVMLSPKMNARENSQAIKISRTVSSPSSPGNSRVSVGLVKTPFRSPLLQSPGSSSSSSVPRSSLGTNQNTGLRIGLSRRTNLKSLHPNKSGK